MGTTTTAMVSTVVRVKDVFALMTWLGSLDEGIKCEVTNLSTKHVVIYGNCDIPTQKPDPNTNAYKNFSFTKELREHLVPGESVKLQSVWIEYSLGGTIRSVGNSTVTVRKAASKTKPETENG